MASTANTAHPNSGGPARRQPGQGTADEISKEDMRAKLQEREHEHLKRIGKAPITKAPPPLPPPGPRRGSRPATRHSGRPASHLRARLTAPHTRLQGRSTLTTRPLDHSRAEDDDDDDDGPGVILDPDDAGSDYSHLHGRSHGCRHRAPAPHAAPHRGR
jgi:hypothetical protein